MICSLRSFALVCALTITPTTILHAAIAPGGSNPSPRHDTVSPSDSVMAILLHLFRFA